RLFCFTTPPTSLFSTLSLHDALPISHAWRFRRQSAGRSAAALANRFARRANSRRGRRCRTQIRGARGPACLGRDIRRPCLESERSEEHTSELQSLAYLVCRLLLEKKK